MLFADIDECRGFPCHRNATCANRPGSYACSCNDHYIGDGRNCTRMWLLACLLLKILRCSAAWEYTKTCDEFGFGSVQCPLPRHIRDNWKTDTKYWGGMKVVVFILNREWAEPGATVNYLTARWWFSAKKKSHKSNVVTEARSLKFLFFAKVLFPCKKSIKQALMRFTSQN